MYFFSAMKKIGLDGENTNSTTVPNQEITIKISGEVQEARIKKSKNQDVSSYFLICS